jgi:hypothetical protein
VKAKSIERRFFIKSPLCRKRREAEKERVKLLPTADVPFSACLTPV